MMADRSDRVRAVVLSLGATAVYTAAFPPFDLGPLAFVALFPIALLTLDPERPLPWGSAVLAGVLFGWGTPLAVTGYWLFHGAEGFLGRSALFSVGFALFVTSVHGLLFMGAAVVVSSRLPTLGPLARIGGFASIWVTFELARAGLLFGTPWALLGHAFSGSPGIAQATALGGIWVLSWSAAITSAALAVAWTERRRAAAWIPATVFALVIPIGLVGYGWSALRRSTDFAPRIDPLAVGLVQPNVERHDLWERSLRARHLDRLLMMSRSPRLRGADLIVWPENAVPFLLDANPDAQRRIASLVYETGAAVLLGAPRSEDAGDATARFFNSVYLFSPDETGYEVYDKLELLPYIGSVLPWASRAQGAPGFQYTPGAEPVTFIVRGWVIAPLVGFESIYPRFARNAARGGADLLVNVSNDSWFDRGAASDPHFGMSLFRSPETGLPMIRVANTGTTASIDPKGRIETIAPRGREEVRLVKVRASSDEPTLYVRHGEWFGWLQVATALGTLGWLLFRQRRARRGLREGDRTDAEDDRGGGDLDDPDGVDPHRRLL